MDKRIFAYDGREHADPDPNSNIEEVKKMFTIFFPELVSADTIEHKKEDGTTIVEFKRKTGIKSGTYTALTPDMLVNALKNVPEYHIDLVDLTWELVGKNGKLDEELTTMKREEIEEAVDQAKAYVGKVTRLVGRIKVYAGRN